jgi:signal transduction histidine kinase
MAGAASAVPVVWATIVWSLGPERAWQVFGVPLLAYVPLTCLGIAVASAISVSWALDEDARQSRIAVLNWQTHVMQQGIWAERMRLGRYLHGSVQAALTSTALQIETSVAKGVDSADIVASVSPKLRELIADLERRSDATPEPVDVTAVLGQITTVWSRVATIDCEVDALAQRACSEDPDAAEKVVEIAREAITNSIRHGRAGSVHVTVARSNDGSIVITVRDDGSAGSGTAGFGSAMLDDLCLEWSRTREQGTVLMCRMATAARLDQPV